MGLRIARSNKADITICGNSDTLFAPGFDVGLVAALNEAHLVGPMTNAAGWGTPHQRYYGRDTSPDDETLEATAEQLAGKPPFLLPPPAIDFDIDAGTSIRIDHMLNGFCLAARTETWWGDAYDATHVFNPAYRMEMNEVELQLRWLMRGRRLAVASSSFVFHYRAITRGDEYLCEGAYRNGQVFVKEQ